MPAIRVTIRGTVFGRVQNIVRYFFTTDPTPDFQGLADALGTELETPYESAAHSDCVLNDMYISLAPTGSLGTSYTPSNFPIAGTLTPTTGLPKDVAVLCVYTTAVIAYPRQNRNRLAGPNEGQLESGVLTVGGQALWLAVAEALGTGVVVDEVAYGGILWSDAYQAFNIVNNIVVRADTSTQRSRRT